MHVYSKPAWRSADAYGHVLLRISLPAKNAEVEECVAKICDVVTSWVEEGTLEEHITFEVDPDFTFSIILGEETEFDRFAPGAPHDSVDAADIDIFDYDAVEEADFSALLRTGAH